MSRILRQCVALWLGLFVSASSACEQETKTEPESPRARPGSEPEVSPEQLRQAAVHAALREQTEISFHIDWGAQALGAEQRSIAERHAALLLDPPYSQKHVFATVQAASKQLGGHEVTVLFRPPEPAKIARIAGDSIEIEEPAPGVATRIYSAGREFHVSGRAAAAAGLQKMPLDARFSRATTDELKELGRRFDVSRSWLLQKAWKLSRDRVADRPRGAPPKRRGEVGLPIYFHPLICDDLDHVAQEIGLDRGATLELAWELAYPILARAGDLESLADEVEKSR